MSEIFNCQKLFRAYLDCRKTKRKTVNALKFEWDMERKLAALEEELISRKYRPGRSTCFVVVNPTIREIFAADFRDRIVHHLLVNEIEKMGEAIFIFESFACRKGKGTHKAIKRLKENIVKITKNNNTKCWYAQLDISGFFMSINHNLLYSIFKKLILKQNKPNKWKEEILWLAKIIIFHKPTEDFVIKGDANLFKLIPKQKTLFGVTEEKGLPIGNYSSQFSANLYLNSLDHFIKRELKCKYYVRYVDDLVILGESREELENIIIKIENFLVNNLFMKLSHKKTKLKPIERGIDFLGYFMKPDYLLVRCRVVKKLKAKLYGINEKENNMPGQELNNLSMINSYYGHFRNAASYNLCKDIYENHLGRLKERFEPAKRFVSLKAAEPVTVIARSVATCLRRQAKQSLILG